jgi:heptaprenyl diphosphate synthase
MSIKLHDRLHIDLGSIDDTLMNVILSDADLPKPSVVFDSVTNLIRAGGKRLRPMMVVVGSRFGEPETPQRSDRVMRMAAMLEYLHMASLVHDDIIDGADQRRGVPTVHKRTDIRTAVLIANYMMVRAVEWAVPNGDSAGDEEDSAEHASRCAELAAMVTELCRGEYSQLHHRFDFAMTMEQYLDKTRNKTAMLMAHCLKAGADAAGATREVGLALHDYGEAIGMAFQIRDDLLDFTQQAAKIGKPVGADLRNGIVTLPVLYAMEDTPLSRRIRSLHADASAADFDAVIEAIAASDALARAEELSQAYVKQAERIADRLAGHPAQPDLALLAEYFA